MGLADLPHVGFNREVGTFPGGQVTPDGHLVGDEEWAAWASGCHGLGSGVRRVIDGRRPRAGRMAGWVAAPSTGIHAQPVTTTTCGCDDERGARQWVDTTLRRGSSTATPTRARRDHVAVHSRRHDATYQSMLTETWRVQQALVELGIRREERVVVMMNDSPEMIAWLVGSMRSA